MTAKKTKAKTGKKTVAAAVAKALEPTTIKLDIGCGPNPKEGFVGADIIQFGNNFRADLGKAPWIFDTQHEVMSPAIGGGFQLPDNSVNEANCTHFLEHLTNFNDKWERIHFWNELWRVMMPGAKLFLILPHWASNRYYGDPTHKEPWSEMAFYYLDKNWRAANAPHSDKQHNPNGFECDWEFNVGYGLHPDIIPKNAETQQFALKFYKEAATDMISTLVARK